MQSGKTSLPTNVLDMTKQPDSEAPVLDFGNMEFTSLPFLPGPLYLGVAVLVRITSMNQIELFNHLLYLKPFNNVQMNE